MKLKKFILAFLAVGTVFLMNLPICAAVQEEYGSTTADITFLQGELVLDEMSSFSFGEHIIESTDRKYPAKESRIYLNVQDLRGTGLGWKITAIGGTFNEPANTLPGTYINLQGGVAVPSISGSTPPDIEDNIMLDMDGRTSVEIATAPAGTGLGNWSIEWNGAINNNTKVRLNVPGGIGRVGTHTATITWTLANAP